MRVLLSIRPQYVERMFCGDKRFEFRRRLPSRLAGSRLALYATLPVGRVVGEARVGAVLSCPPDELWALTSDGAGMGEGEFRHYFAGREVAHAFEVVDLARIAPTPLEAYAPALRRPPQSFAYLP